MALPVKLSDIKMEILAASDGLSAQKEMLSGEIPGARVINYTFVKEDTHAFAGQNEYIRIFFLCIGTATFIANGRKYPFNEKAVFVPRPQDDVSFAAGSNGSLLEIRWDLNENDIQDLDSISDMFPIVQLYDDAPQYRDFFKSETTISRAIIKQSIIPRFAMGSVEANGDDLVGQHAHPLLDQFFFTLPENDMDLLIDCRICPVKGNTLVHIPLGSNHGVIARGNQKMHYLWLDFTPQEQKDEAVAYLNEVHKPTGVKQML